MSELEQYPWCCLSFLCFIPCRYKPVFSKQCPRSAGARNGQTTQVLEPEAWSGEDQLLHAFIPTWLHPLTHGAGVSQQKPGSVVCSGTPKCSAETRTILESTSPIDSSSAQQQIVPEDSLVRRVRNHTLGRSSTPTNWLTLSPGIATEGRELYLEGTGKRKEVQHQFTSSKVLALALQLR